MYNITALFLLLFICTPTFAYQYPLGDNGQLISMNAMGPSQWSAIAQAKYKAFPNGLQPTYDFNLTELFGAFDLGYMQFYATGGCHGGGSAVTTASPEQYNGTKTCALLNLDGDGQSYTIGNALNNGEGTLSGNCQISFFSSDDCSEASWVGYTTGAAQAPTCNYALDLNLSPLGPSQLVGFNSWCNPG